MRGRESRDPITEAVRESPSGMSRVWTWLSGRGKAAEGEATPADHHSNIGEKIASNADRSQGRRNTLAAVEDVAEVEAEVG